MSFWSQLIGHRADSIAVIDEDGEHTYQELLDRARLLADRLIQKEVKGQFVVFLTGRESAFVVALLAIWLADAVAVPLYSLMPAPEWEWHIRDLEAKYIVYSPSKQQEALDLKKRLDIDAIDMSEIATGVAVPLKTLIKAADTECDALVLYTSGISRSPRGVVHTFKSLEAQVKTLCCAWRWQPEDRLLHILPLSHIHGLVCGLMCTLVSGGSCEIMSSFKTSKVWDSLAAKDKTLITAVPTIYKYLVESWNGAPEETRERWKQGAESLRLAIVGSSPLSPSIHKAWRKISGQPLLSRYGMTESGMVLSQSIDNNRAQENMGKPLSGVSIRLIDDYGNENGSVGELEVRSPQMFRGYFGREDLNQKAFRDGWFRTGDIVVCEEGFYRLLGKRSVDIIKSRGYKVSALEVETLLGLHPSVDECTVFGIPCDGMDEEVCACIVLSSSHVQLDEIRQWLRMELATYKLPTRLHVTEKLPKTKQGKVDKLALKRSFGHCAQGSVGHK